LERAGFQVETIGLIPRPTPVSSGIGKWLEIFADGMIRHLDTQQQRVFLHKVCERLKPVLYSETDGWVVDYVRLRFRAVKV
jgi:2-isopropylmalate synthase